MDALQDLTSLMNLLCNYTQSEITSTIMEVYNSAQDNRNFILPPIAEVYVLGGSIYFNYGRGYLSGFQN